MLRARAKALEGIFVNGICCGQKVALRLAAKDPPSQLRKALLMIYNSNVYQGGSNAGIEMGQ